MKRFIISSAVAVLTLTPLYGQKKGLSNHIPFEALKIGNLESTKVAKGGELYFNVSHRFGSVKGGFKTFFGLDQANTRIQLLYGIGDWAHIAVSRESIRKTYSGDLKFRIMRQSEKRWLTITGYTSIHCNTELSREVYPKMLFEDRLSYATQLLIARKFHDRFTLEIAPTYIRQNLVLEPFQLHNQLAMGLGARFRLSKRLSLNMEYVMNLYRAEQSIYKDPLSIGLDFETGGHVFQLLFSNAQSLNGPGFMTNAEGDWWKGDIFFGFNISRKFRLH